jgi:hypothetical protein
VVEASLNGGSSKTLVTGQNGAAAVVIDGSHIYWSDGGAGTISEASLDGSNPKTLVTGQNAPWGMAISSK